MPDAEITILSYTTEVDSLKFEKYGIKVLPGLRFSQSNHKWKIAKGITMLNPWLRRGLWAISYRLLKRDIRWLKGNEVQILNKYTESDVIVSCGGEVIWGNADYILFNLLEIFPGKLINKPVIIYAHSIGSFNSKLAELIARLFLNRADLITLRESISEEYLQAIKVNRPPIIVTADPAFLLQPVSSQTAKALLAEERIDLKKMSIGLNLRHWSFPETVNPQAKHKVYVKNISKVADYIINKLNATLVFVPEVVFPDNTEFEDDRAVAQEVFQLINNKEGFKILTKDYSPEEIKGIIGEMDLFIGTRMHSNIFALSMYVPTVAIGYRHKTKGIMEMLQMGKYVCQIDNLEFEDMVQKIEEVLANRENIQRHLKAAIPSLQKRALYNAELVKDLLQTRK